MIVYPAIDLRDGKVVRLREGDPAQQTVFSSDPVATAEKWQDIGASWLHMVNLDGAFNHANDNLEILRDVAKLNLRIQFGGGVRSLDDVARALDLGASRVILGTIAVRNPEILSAAISRFGRSVCVSRLTQKTAKSPWTGGKNLRISRHTSLGLSLQKWARSMPYLQMFREMGNYRVSPQKKRSRSRKTPG